MNHRLGIGVALAMLLPWAAGAELVTGTVRAQGSAADYALEGVVEAVRQTAVSAQVPGRVTVLAVKAGDRVRRGQLLLRIDPEVADQQALASRAQVAQAEAMLDAARSDYQRSERLAAKQYLSQAALERAQEHLRSSTAQAEAMRAQAAAAGAGLAFHTVLAPYDGVVAAVAVERGDLALPGKALVTLFDPAALRVVAEVPESVLPRLRREAPARVELPNADAASRVQSVAHPSLMPTVDPGTHSQQLRLTLPHPAGVAPGQFATVHLALSTPAPDTTGNPRVARSAVVIRGELEAVYVVDGQGHAHLRQVRTGPIAGDQVEILAGLHDGERIALDPIAAASATGAPAK